LSFVVCLSNASNGKNLNGNYDKKWVYMGNIPINLLMGIFKHFKFLNLISSWTRNK
jgi:hypothetical protein